MEIKIHEKGNYGVLELKGNLDMYTSVEVKNAIGKLPVKEGYTVVLDLSGVSFIDSSGIGMLIKVLNEIKAKKGAFYIAGMKPVIEKVFKVAGLMGYFSFLSDEEFREKYPVE